MQHAIPLFFAERLQRTCRICCYKSVPPETCRSVGLKPRDDLLQGVVHLSKQGCALPPGIKANPASDNPATYDFTLNKTSAAGVGGFPGLAAATSSGGLHKLLSAAVRTSFGQAWSAPFTAFRTLVSSSMKTAVVASKDSLLFIGWIFNFLARYLAD